MFLKYVIQGFYTLFIDIFGLVSRKKRELYKSRLDICFKCKYLNGDFCSLCGCYIKAKTKVNYSLDKNGKSVDGCPKRYW